MHKQKRFFALLCAVILAVACVTASTAATDTATHRSYIDGLPDGLFHPNDHITRAQVAQMVYNIKGNLKPGTKSFADVDKSAWYATAVSALTSAGIMNGYPNGMFKPTERITRAEFVHIVVTMSGKKYIGAKPSFADVPASHWAYKSISIAKASGWIKGSGGAFRPNDNLTRAEAVTILNSYLSRSADRSTLTADPTVRYFPDVNPSNWFYYDVMEAAVSHTATYSGSYETWSNVTRYKTMLPDGFVMVLGNIRLVRNGYFVTAEESGSFGGVSYQSDKSGNITVSDGVLRFSDGSASLIIDGKAVSESGLFDTPDGLYCIRDGTIVTNRYYNTLYFGADGRYTSGNSTIDSFIESIISQVTNKHMTQEERLRACYDYIYNHIDYRANNNHVPRGAAPSEWTEEYMLRLINTGKGNCYCYAAEMYYMARRLGYWSATAVSGGVTPDNLDHGWTTIVSDGHTLMLDPELDVSSGPYVGSIFLVTYEDAPFHYWAN